MSFPLLLGVSLLLGQVDAGYVRERTSDGQHCLRWPVSARSTAAVTFVQSTAGDDKLGPGLFDAVSRSEGSWAAQASACSSLALLEGGHSPSRDTGYDRTGSNENLILVRTSDCFRAVGANDPCRSNDTCGNVYDCWDHGAAILAITLLTYDATGALLDTDIEVNGALSYLSLVDSPPCSPGAITPSCVGNDVQNTVTHEFGHALGLGHSPDPASTMYGTGPLGETSKRVLDPASKQFVCDVYAPGFASRDCFLPDGGTDPSAGGTGGTGGGPSGTGGPGGPGIASTSSGCSAAGAGASRAGLLGGVLAALLAGRRRAGR
ncbi:MAG TPA: myxosortase-dependent metalloprotease, MXAN_2677/MXAN_2678 family [Myxococcaceae bacterium]|nr:myxosortase-dependent metalloprotease, MXAN_2677/MXAN_2678 family [Myxococcaceae bacterium]